MAERRIEVVYCDDIRLELGNKHSLMGVYPADMFIDIMPVVLPKLCAWVNVVTPVGKPFDRLRVRVLHDDVTLIDTGELIEDGSMDLPSQHDDSTQGDNEERLMAFNFLFTISPFSVDAESSLQIVAETEDGDMKSRRLRIRKGAPPPFTKMPLNS